MLRRIRRPKASRIPLPGARGSQTEIRRKSFRRPRFLRGLRQKENKRTPPETQLRSRRILRRTPRRPSQTKSQSKSLRAVLSCQLPVPRPLLLLQAFNYAPQYGEAFHSELRTGYSTAGNCHPAKIFLLLILISSKRLHVKNSTRHRSEEYTSELQ